MTVRLTMLLGAAIACSAPTPTSKTKQAKTQLVTSGPFVANVNGHPVPLECVRIQSESTGESTEKALEDCIGLELLAQEAESKGYGTHPLAVRKRRQEMVRSFVDREFGTSSADPTAIPESFLRNIYKKNHHLFVHPEYRFTVYVRAGLSKDPTPIQNREAQSIAKEIYRQVREERKANGKPISKQRIYDLAQEVAGDRPIELGKPFDFPREGRAVPEFAEAAFRIPGVGQTSPPTRTPWGWDVILLTKILPAENRTFEEVRGEIAGRAFIRWRRGAFMKWSEELYSGHSVQRFPYELSSIDINAPKIPGANAKR